MLPLPEALLLFALHDDTGTVVSSAFLSLDHTLRGAILAELRLRGFVQTRSDGMLRLHPEPPEARLEPVLAQALAVIGGDHDEPRPVPPSLVHGAEQARQAVVGVGHLAAVLVMQSQGCLEPARHRVRQIRYERARPGLDDESLPLASREAKTVHVSAPSALNSAK